jgi:hypothetical protein
MLKSAARAGFRGIFASFVVACLTITGASAMVSPTVEFDTPYQVRVVADGLVLEISGSFSWALPQNVQAMLASEPRVRVVRLESPGGHLLPALQVADIIKQRGLDTYVGRFCASACTVAFLGGRQRWLGPEARLGFHQAYAPGVSSDQANIFMQAAYEKFDVPPAFVAHVLRTPHTDLWFPQQDELRAIHMTTGAPPQVLVALGGGPLPRLDDIARQVPGAPDPIVVEFATTLSGLLTQLQDVDPEACWAFAHEGPDNPATTVPRSVLDAIVVAGRKVADAATDSQPPSSDTEQRKKAAMDLMETMRAKGQVDGLQGLRPGADHATFCPSLREYLKAALAWTDPRRVLALRAVLSAR